MEETKMCRYFKSSMIELLEYCRKLYELDGCAAGGPLHILLDDDNYEDADIMFCLRECLAHPEHPGSRIGFNICQEYLKMSMEERSLFDWMWNGFSGECSYTEPDDCDYCEYIFYEE